MAGGIVNNFTFNNSCDLNNPVRRVYSYSHLIDEKWKQREVKAKVTQLEKDGAGIQTHLG